MKEVEHLTEQEARFMLSRLAKQLAKHSELYHTKDQPVIDDAEYDALFKRSVSIEERFPHLVLPNSPSTKVGGPVSGAFGKITHAVPMLSLDNAFSEADVVDKVKQMRKFLALNDTDPLAMTSELKIDGLSLSLRYELGYLVSAATRGDGAVGEDVTANARVVKGIPWVLPPFAPEILEVRGEVHMPKQVFLDLNTSIQEKADKAGKTAKLYANPRNAAAGSLRQIDVSNTAARNLEFIFHGLGEVSSPVADTWMKTVGVLQDWGFGAADTSEGIILHSGNIKDLMKSFEEIEVIRSSLSFDIDGVVHKVDDLELRKRLGQVSRTPRWAFAHKFPAEQARTTLNDITVQVGRTGRITPVARVNPINVGGVIVSNTTLHNEAHIQELDVRIGDTVLLQRAGDVVPQIVKYVTEDDLHEALDPWVFPTHCPTCGAILERAEDEADTYCTGGLHCEAQIVERLKHMVSRDAFDIKGIGDEAIREFHAMGILSSPSDLFHLGEHRDTILLKEGWANVSVDKMLASIEEGRRQRFDRAMYALGIHHVGRTATKALARKMGDVTTLMDMFDDLRVNVTNLMATHLTAGMDARKARTKALQKAADIVDIAGIGPEIVGSFIDFLGDSENKKILLDLWAELDIQPLEQIKTITSDVAGQTIVFSGSFSTMSRDEAKAQAERLGAKASSAVSAKTNLLVAGPGAGSKLSQAAALGVKTISEEEWLLIVASAG